MASLRGVACTVRHALTHLDAVHKDADGEMEVQHLSNLSKDEAIELGSIIGALIGLGIIIEGETHHARLLAEQAARGIMDVQLQYGIPFAFEILYVDSLSLARERLDKGREAAYAVPHSLEELKRIRREKH